MLKITNLCRQDQKALHLYRLKKGHTFIEDFACWKAAWKNYPSEFEIAYNEWKQSMINPTTASLSSGDFVKACVALNTTQVKSISTANIFGCKQAAPVHDECCYDIPPSRKQEKENTMDTRTEAQQAKDYLIKSLDQALWNKKVEAETTFHLNHQRPATVKELREAIANGFLVVPEELDDKQSIYYWQDAVVYQDPSKKPDRKGYDAALVQMSKDASDTKDQIVVFGAEKGLEALNAFKANEYK